MVFWITYHNLANYEITAKKEEYSCNLSNYAKDLLYIIKIKLYRLVIQNFIS